MASAPASWSAAPVSSLVISLLVALTVIPMLASRRFAPEPGGADEVDAGRGSLVARGSFLVTLGLAKGSKLLGRGLAGLLRFAMALPLRIFGLFFLLFAIPWLVFFPRSYMELTSSLLPSNLMGWRLLGLLGAIVGLVLVYFGWDAL